MSIQEMDLNFNWTKQNIIRKSNRNIFSDFISGKINKLKTSCFILKISVLRAISLKSGKYCIFDYLKSFWA